MPASPAVPGLVLCTAAAVLLIFGCVSSPTWEKISFLNVGTGSSQVHYGIFGHTGSQTHIGYDFVGAGSSQINTTVINNATKAFILHPIAAGLAGLSVLFGLCGAGAYSRIGTIFMSLLAALSTVITLIVWVLEMAVFGAARDKYRNAGVAAQYGNANWMTLGALVALLAGFCVGICGVFGRYRRGKATY